MAEASKQSTATIDVDLVAQQFDALDTDTHRVALLEAIRARDAYRKLTDELMAKVAKLERGLIGPKSQRFKGDDGAQLSLAVLAELLGVQDTEGVDAETLAAQLVEQAEADAEASTDGDADDEAAAAAEASAHRNKSKPTGRNTERDRLHKTSIELLPEEVERLGTDAFERIGEERSVSLERYVSTLIEVTVIRPKFRAKTPQAEEAVKQARLERGLEARDPPPQSWITTAAPVSMPIERGMAGPALLANVIVRRFDDHLPYNRLENVYDREGMRLGRSTLYGWLEALLPLLKPLVEAMRADARAAPYLCTDATGVLVQAPDKCKRGHFWVLVAPGRHVLFFFSHKHDSAAVDEVLGDYDGHVVADVYPLHGAV